MRRAPKRAGGCPEPSASWRCPWPGEAFGGKKYYGAVAKRKIEDVKVATNGFDEDAKTFTVGLGRGFGCVKTGVSLTLLPDKGA